MGCETLVLSPTSRPTKSISPLMGAAESKHRGLREGPRKAEASSPILKFMVMLWTRVACPSQTTVFTRVTLRPPLQAVTV